MPQFTLQQLIARANAGNIGSRGVKRLQDAGITPDQPHPLGMGAWGGAQLQVNPQADLQARRAALYAHALQASHDLQPGQTLSAGLQRRLQLGSGGAVPVAPRAVAGAQQWQGSNYTSLLDELKKRSQGIASKAAIYR